MSTQENSHLRREGYYERSHMYVPGDNVIVTFRIEGNFSEGCLQEAINGVRKIHPMIGVHIEFDSKRAAWFVEDGTPPCPLKIFPRIDETTWLSTVLAEYWLPFNLAQGPLIRFLWIKGEKISEIVAFAQHSICDGLSLVYLLRDLMKLLGDSKISLPLQNKLPTVKEVYDLDSLKINPIIQKILQKFNKVWKERHIEFDETDFAPLHAAFQEHKINATSWTLNEVITKKLIERCHQEGVSVNSALYCAILNIQHRSGGEKESFRKNIMMPINFRNIVKPPIGEAVGLFAGGDAFAFKVKWTDPFWKQTRKIHAQLQKLITPARIFLTAKRSILFEPTLMDARLMLFMGGILSTPPPKYLELMKIIERDRFLAKLKAKNTKTQLQFGSILTNIGAINIPDTYGVYQLHQVIFLPPSSLLAEKLIGVVTFKNQLQGMLAFTEKTLDPNLAAKFTRELVFFLESSIK